jgi:serine/threonine-protein kinase
LIGALLEQRYRVDALLARGGMSAVYRGLDTRLDRRVAIKVMDERFADDRNFVDRFEREARSAAKIHHPNVVAVHDQGVDRSPVGDLVYLVMELVDGGTLRDLIAERPLDVPLALAVMEPVLAALAAAHRAGLVHRDVKPENVLIGHGGESGTAVKVGDFGLVRAIHSAGTTSASVILGTVAYLSPEQVTTGAATARGDVYSAGIVLFETLTGTAPYTGDSAISVAYRHVNDDVPAPSTLVSGIPPELDELVLRVTRRNPAARPADGAAFLTELLNLRTRLGVPSIPVPVPAPTIADLTVPVSPATLAAAAARNPAAGATSGELSLGEPESERTVTNGVPVAASAVANATIVRQAPPGFRPIGPQGTRAMLRNDMDRAGAPTEFVPPTHAPHTPTSGRLPAQQQPPRANQQRPPRPQAPPRKPPNRTSHIVLWSTVAVLVLALVGTTTWWFTSGRWRTVPDVAGLSQPDAEAKLTDSDLKPQVELQRHNTVERGTVIGTEPGDGQEILRGEPIKLIVSMGRPRVPQVAAGSEVADAERRIRDAKLVPDRDDGQNEFSDEVPKGKVLDVNPSAGSELEIGKRVVIVLSKGPEPKPVPDVKNKTHDEAVNELRSKGFEPVDLPGEFSAEVEGGRVIRTDPEAGKKLDGDKKVGIVVSTAVTVPDLTGRTVDEARGMLAQVGLQIEITGVNSGGAHIAVQQPGANSRVQPGTKIGVFAI